MHIGLIGEDPLDTISIKNLLSKQYRYNFYTLIKNQKGHQLDNLNKTQRLLDAELKFKKYDLIVFIRDLDSYENDEIKKQSLIKWYETLSIRCNSRTIFLLNIYEIEALIISDIDSFNSIFKTSIKYTKNPCLQKDPKEFLIRETRKGKRPYKESDNPEVFSNLDLNIVKGNCSFFNKFIRDFEGFTERKSKVSKVKN